MPPRPRPLYFLWLLLTICLGLLSRSKQIHWPSFIIEYAGDSLWALMVFVGVGLLMPTLSTWRAAGLAITFSYLIELSQLYHAPWIDVIRRTRIGALILGQGFLWSDLVCYTVGITLGLGLELALSRLNRFGKI